MDTIFNMKNNLLYKLAFKLYSAIKNIFDLIMIIILALFVMFKICVTIVKYDNQSKLLKFYACNQNGIFIF